MFFFLFLEKMWMSKKGIDFIALWKFETTRIRPSFRIIHLTSKGSTGINFTFASSRANQTTGGPQKVKNNWKAWVIRWAKKRTFFSSSFRKNIWSTWISRSEKDSCIDEFICLCKFVRKEWRNPTNERTKVALHEVYRKFVRYWCNFYLYFSQ